MYQLGLFLHLASLVFAFYATGMVAAGLWRLRRAEHTGEARTALHDIERSDKMHPIAMVGLLLTGAYMTQTQWSWSTPWIDAAIVALVLIGAFSGGVLGARMKAVMRAMADVPEGPISPAVRARLNDPVMLAGSNAIPFFVFATMWIMIAEPSGPACAAILAAGAVVGAVVGTLLLPAKSPQAVAASEA